MAIFQQKKDYNTIVAPLKKIEADLSTYIGDQGNKIAGLEQDKEKIENEISNSKLEIKRSEHTVVKISELLSIDINGDGEVDFVEPPIPPEEVPDENPEPEDTEPDKNE